MYGHEEFPIQKYDLFSTFQLENNNELKGNKENDHKHKLQV